MNNIKEVLRSGYLISVIIPVYNVEKYLRRCIISVQNQAYRNLEIILVDDGSTDRSGSICDEFARKDNRIIVVHKKNGGLSSARNVGLDICRGEYIGFVDSDDFIHERMYDLLLKDILDFNVLLSFCQPNMCTKEIPKVQISTHTECKKKGDVILLSLRRQIWWSAYTKLYHKSLFKEIRYPEGKNNEDYPVTMKIFDKCDHIAVNYNSLYYYCIRPNSICTSSFNPHKLDQIDTSMMVLEYMEQNHPGICEKLAENILLSAVLGVYFDTIQLDSDYYKSEANRLQRIVRRRIFFAMFNSYVLWKSKILLISLALNSKFYKLLVRIIYKKK